METVFHPAGCHGDRIDRGLQCGQGHPTDTIAEYSSPVGVEIGLYLPHLTRRLLPLLMLPQ